MMLRMCIAALLVLCVHLPAAHAIVIRADLTPDLDEIDVPVMDKRITTVIFPESIRDWQNGNQTQYKVYLAKGRTDSLNVEVARGAPPSNLNIETWSGKRVSLLLYTVSKRQKAASRVEFTDPDAASDVVLRDDASATERRVGQWLAGARHVDTPATIEWRRDGYHLVLDTGFTVHGEDMTMLPITVRCRGDYAYPLEELQLLDHLDRPVDAAIVHRSGSDWTHVELRPGQEIGVVFRVSDPNQVAKGWTVVATPAAGIAPARFSWRPERERGPFEGRILVSLRAFGGAGNLDDGVGNDKTSWTLMQGIGTRVTYGVARNISIEASLDLTRAGDAVFADASWDQDQGALRVSESAGRLLAGGRLHTAGKRWVPYASLGVGVRFSRHEVSMEARNESVIRSSALFGFGAGLDVFLGKRLLGGLSFAYAAPLGGNDTAQTIEAGLHVGAIWDLSGTP